MNTSIISITDLRKNLFKIADMVEREGKEVEVEKEGKRIIKLVKITDDPRERAKRMLKIMNKIGGTFKNVKFDTEFFHGEKEKKYMESLGKWDD